MKSIADSCTKSKRGVQSTSRCEKTLPEQAYLHEMHALVVQLVGCILAQRGVKGSQHLLRLYESHPERHKLCTRWAEMLCRLLLLRHMCRRVGCCLEAPPNITDTKYSYYELDAARKAVNADGTEMQHCGWWC